MIVEESIHVIFDEFNDLSLKDVPRNAGIEENIEKLEITQDDKETQEEEWEGHKIGKVLPQLGDQQQNGENSSLPKEWRFVYNHPTNLIIGDPSRGITTRNSLRNICENLAFLSQIEPKNFNEAKFDEYWLLAMQEEFNQFEKRKVWILVQTWWIRNHY